MQIGQIQGDLAQEIVCHAVFVPYRQHELVILAGDADANGLVPERAKAEDAGTKLSSWTTQEKQTRTAYLF